MIKVKKLVWDKWNIEHIKKHQVSKAEVKLAVQNIIIELETHSNRLLIAGRCNKRLITVILVEQTETNVYYPVTARDSSKKERQKIYESEDKKNS